MADAYAALAIANRWRGDNSSMGILADAFIALVVNEPPSGRPLTKRQAEIMTFLIEQIDANHYAPSFEEIAARFGYRSLATVHEHLQAIERKGWISREYNESRAITIRHRLKSVVDDATQDPSESAKVAMCDPDFFPEPLDA